jgi:hypothetical protein
MEGVNERCRYHSVQNRLSSVCYQRVLESRVLRDILGPRREEVTADWTKLDNEGHNDLYWGLVEGET